jgi:hypothetical protein
MTTGAGATHTPTRKSVNNTKNQQHNNITKEPAIEYQNKAAQQDSMHLLVTMKKHLYLQNSLANPVETYK